MAACPPVGRPRSAIRVPSAPRAKHENAVPFSVRASSAAFRAGASGPARQDSSNWPPPLKLNGSSCPLPQTKIPSRVPESSASRWATRARACAFVCLRAKWFLRAARCSATAHSAPARASATEAPTMARFTISCCPPSVCAIAGVAPRTRAVAVTPRAARIAATLPELLPGLLFCPGLGPIPIAPIHAETGESL